jgi:trk system potassium uptake protein TrkH
VLVTTALLLLSGWGITFVTEFSNPLTLGTLALPGKLLASFFHSVTARTAGFATMNVAAMMTSTLLFTMILMFIGGVVGSTAGGIKVNTFGLLVAALWSTLRGHQTVSVFRHEIDEIQIRRAMTVVLLSLVLLFAAAFLLNMTENAPLLSILFETVSAFGTVGLSTGITPALSVSGKLIIAAIIFIGRLGPITLATVLVQKERPSSYRNPRANIRIG